MSMFDCLKDIGNYDRRAVDRHKLKNGLIVSTAFTSDEGYETALIDKNGTHPVERYADRAASIVGHGKWLAFAKDGVGKTVSKLGGWGLVKDKPITLEV